MNESIPLRNYAHIGDAVWEVFVREYVVFRTSNTKTMHKMSTDRVNAAFQKKMLEIVLPLLTKEEQELVRRGRNLPIPVGRRTIQNDYRHATAFEVLVGYWYLENKNRLYEIFSKIKLIEEFR